MKQQDTVERVISEVLDYINREVLFGYQREWVSDQSRFKIYCKARQIGISLCLGLEGFLDALAGQPVYFVSRTERQSIYLLGKFYHWMRFVGYRMRSISRVRGLSSRITFGRR